MLRLGVAVSLACVAAMGVARSQEAPPWDPSPHRVRFVEVDQNLTLEVLDWGGAGRPIVLLAGLGNTAHVFDEFAPKLTDHGHVIGITRRGYGASTHAETGYDAERLGNDVLAVLDQLDLVKPVLVGHSIAGQELSHIASSRPERVSGVIYLDAAYRYAYFRPGVRENLQELRNRLDILDAELQKPPRSPAELTEVIRSTLGDALTEFQKDLEELMTSPPISAGAPPPGPADLQDFAAYRAWSTRVHGYALPEAELRHVRTVADSGGPGAPKTPPAVAQAISAGAKRFTSIGVPALAIFASPHRLGPWTDAHPDRRAAFEAFARFDQAMTERQAAAFERGVTGARVIRLPNASHYMFITEEAAVLREIMAFLNTLAETDVTPERFTTALQPAARSNRYAPRLNAKR
jgi:non-heme chloroperoxidase